MVFVRVRDNDSRPHPTELTAVPLIQADPFLLTPNRRRLDAKDPAWPFPLPSTTNFQYADEPQFLRFEPSRSKPLFQGFERPSFTRIAILTALCLAANPAFYILTLVAKDRSLFVVRFLVSMWCSVIGFALGYILLRLIGAQHLEAASELVLVGHRDFLT